MSKKPRIDQRQLIASTRLFRVEQVDLTFSNGEQRQYERLLGGERGSVLVVPLLDQDTLLLIREYATGSNRYELAFPKGRIEAGEEALSAAERELREEVGYGSRHCKLLRTVALAPGYIRHDTHLILAQDLFPARAEGDEPEPIEVVPWKLDDLEGLLTREDFNESRSILALFLTLHHLER